MWETAVYEFTFGEKHQTLIIATSKSNLIFKLWDE